MTQLCEPIRNYVGSASATDNCSAVAEIDITQSPTSGTTIGLGITTITITAEDEAGNTAQCDFTVTAFDNIDPSITCPSNQDIILDGNCEYDIADFTGATVSDNCSLSANIEVTQLPVSGTTLSGNGTAQTITLTAEDEAENTQSCSFQLTLNDETNPSIVCPANQNLAVGNNCFAIVPDYTNAATVLDNCTATIDISTAQMPIVGTILVVVGSTTTITLTAEDEVENSNDCTFNITLTDEIDPEIFCPSNTSIDVDDDCEISILNYTSAVTIDNCSATMDIDVIQMPIAGTTVSGHGTVQTVTLTAEDESGNTQNCTFDITLNDDIDPELTCPANQTLIPNADCEVILPDYTAATVDDNCTAPASIGVTQLPAAGTTFSPMGGTATVTLIANDGNGNSTDCTFSIIFGDNFPPTITCPTDKIKDINTDCKYTIEDFTGEATVADNCAAVADIDVTQSPIVGIILTGAGTVQAVTLTADDGNGNIESCSFNVTLRDDICPAIICPTNANMVVDDECEITLADYTSAAVSTDNCSSPSNIIVAQIPLAGMTLSGNGTAQTVTLTAADESGNTKDCTLEVTLLDETDPTIICPTDQTADLDANCEAILGDYRGMATLDDNCTPVGVITVTQSPIPLTQFNDSPSEEIITITADDNNGNMTSCTFKLTFQDVTDPIITCPTELEKDLNANCEYTLEDLTGLVVGANECADDTDLTITQLPSAGTVFDNIPSSQVITLTATDNSGNSTICQIEINLNDNIDPEITCPGSQIETGAGCEKEIESYLSEVMVTDNCSIFGNITLIQSPPAGTILNAGVNTITITAEDESGNTASCAFVLELDLTPPTMPVISGN